PRDGPVRLRVSRQPRHLRLRRSDRPQSRCLLLSARSPERHLGCCRPWVRRHAQFPDSHALPR
ncbi:hypothetical protein BN1723_020930, partial [Verticillium longisporum]